MKLVILLLSLVFVNGQIFTSNTTTPNGCISFTIGSGTGCSWMCNYCYDTLKTTNYYFTDGVCTYQTGGCVGNPLSGKTYTCCTI